MTPGKWLVHVAAEVTREVDKSAGQSGAASQDLAHVLVEAPTFSLTGDQQVRLWAGPIEAVAPGALWPAP